MSSLSQQTVSQETTPATTTEVATTTTTSSGRGNQAAVSAAGLDSSTTGTSTTDAATSAAAGTAAGLEVLGEDVGAVLDAMPLEAALALSLPNQQIEAVLNWLLSVPSAAIMACAAARRTLIDFFWPVGQSVEVSFSGKLEAGFGVALSGALAIARPADDRWEVTFNGEIQTTASIGLGGAEKMATVVPVAGLSAGASMVESGTGKLVWGFTDCLMSEASVAGLLKGDSTETIESFKKNIEERVPESWTLGGKATAKGDAGGGLGGCGVVDQASASTGVEFGVEATNPDQSTAVEEEGEQEGEQLGEEGEQEGSEWVLRFTAGADYSKVVGIISGIEAAIAALTVGAVLEVRAPTVAGIPDPTSIYFRLIISTGSVNGTTTDVRDFRSLSDVQTALTAVAVMDDVVSSAGLAPLDRKVAAYPSNTTAALGCIPDVVDQAADLTPLGMALDTKASLTLESTLTVGAEAVGAAGEGLTYPGGAGALQSAVADACAPSAADTTVFADLAGADVTAGLAASLVKDSSITLSIVSTVGGEAQVKYGATGTVGASAVMKHSMKVDLNIPDALVLKEILETGVLPASVAVTTPATELAAEMTTASGAETATAESTTAETATAETATAETTTAETATAETATTETATTESATAETATTETTSKTAPASQASTTKSPTTASPATASPTAESSVSTSPSPESSVQSATTNTDQAAPANQDPAPATSQERSGRTTRERNTNRGHHNVRPGPFGRRMQDAA